jgi:hypothetical protein
LKNCHLYSLLKFQVTMVAGTLHFPKQEIDYA